MLVPPLSIHSRKRASIFSSRGSPERILESSRQIVHFEQTPRYLNATLPESILPPSIYDIPRQPPLRVPIPFAAPMHHMRFNTPLMIPTLALVDPLIPDFGLISNGSPIVRQAPSTYFQLTQKILLGSTNSARNLYHDRSLSSRRSRYLPASPQKSVKAKQIVRCNKNQVPLITTGNQNSSRVRFVKEAYLNNDAIGDGGKRDEKRFEGTVSDENKLPNSSTVSFGNNQNRPKRQDYQDKLQSQHFRDGPEPQDRHRKPRAPGDQQTFQHTGHRPNLSIHENEVNQTIQRPSGFSPELLSLFKGVLQEAQIEIPETYPKEWISILKQCQSRSQEQRDRIIRERLTIWRKFRETIIEEESNFDNTIIEQDVADIKSKNRKFFTRISKLQEELSKYQIKYKDFVQGDSDEEGQIFSKQQKLDSLSKIRNQNAKDYEVIAREIDELINRFSTVTVNEGPLVVSSYFQ